MGHNWNTSGINRETYVPVWHGNWDETKRMWALLGTQQRVRDTNRKTQPGRIRELYLKLKGGR